jgi:hypothetical protein
MIPCCAQDDVHTPDELRRFMHKTLCEKENLLADQFSMTELPARVVVGSGRCSFASGQPRRHPCAHKSFM